MSTAAELHAQIASIIEVLANSAVAEICKAVEDGYAVVNLEMSRSLKENECLRRRVRLLELQVSRYRAEQRLKAPQEGAASGRVFPGVRLLHHRTGRDTPAGSSQSRSRFMNRSVSQPQKTPPTNLDQDPDQEVVTTTKTEPTESEEDSDLIIVKVEGSVSVDDHSVSNDNSSSAPPPPPCRASNTQVQSSSQMEVSGSQTSNETPDVIVIDKEDIPSENTPPLSQKKYVEKAWLSFLTPPCSSETAGTSSSVAASFLTNTVTPDVTVSNQCFETINPSQKDVNLSGAASQSSNTSGTSPQGSFSGQTFAPHPAPVTRLFSCSKCPMSFFQEAERVKHAASHRSRRYVCGLCGKAFVCKSQLEIHQNVHTGEKPFICGFCNSSFSHPSNLRRHKKLQHQQHIAN